MRLYVNFKWSNRSQVGYIGKGVKDNKVSGPGGITWCTCEMREKEVAWMLWFL